MANVLLGATGSVAAVRVPALAAALAADGHAVKVVATGRLIPELGESNATANKSAVDKMAKQIVNMMEVAW